jgi:hypothetical protein
MHLVVCSCFVYHYFLTGSSGVGAVVGSVSVEVAVVAALMLLL